MRQIQILFLSICCIFSTLGHATIKIGTLLYDPPFIISPHAGFDIDLSRLICQRMNTECQIMQMTPQQLYNSLKNGAVDIAISGISISDTQKKTFIFSLPYMLSTGQFLTLKNSTIETVDELKGTTVGVIRADLSGDVFFKYLIHNYSGRFAIKHYETVEDMLSALSNKIISAVFLYRSDVIFWNHNGGNLFKPLGPILTLGEGMAVMALPHNALLIRKINKVLEDIEDEDTYINLYKTYFSDQ